MKVVKVKRKFDFEIKEVDSLSPQQNEVLVKVNYCGVCGSDIHYAEFMPHYVNVGHEISGKVDKVGPNVTMYKPGDTVVIHSSTWCGQCENCMNGFPLLCDQWGGGFTTPCHGFSEYVVVESKYLMKVDKISPLQATLIEPLGVAVETVLTSEISFGHKVAILGPGPIGLMMVLICKKRGATKVYLTGLKVDEKRLQRGLELGADEVFLAEEVDPVAGIKRLHPEGVDSTIITAHPKLVNQAIEMTKFGGIITLLAIGAPGEENVTLNVHELHTKKQQLRSSQPNPNGYFPLCKRLLEEGVIDYKKIITHIFYGAEEVEKAFKFAHEKKDGVIKAVVKMSVND